MLSLSRHILYIGESENIEDGMTKHMHYYNKKIELEFVFSDEERAMHKVFSTGKEMIVLKKTHAFNIEDILIDYCSETVTNSDSGQPTYGIVRNMLPEKKDQVARLILQGILDAKETAQSRKSL